MKARVRIAGWGLAAVAFSNAPRARAAASAHLVYVRGPGAEECPGESAVRAAVEARLGYDPFFAWAHDTLFAEISRVDGAFRVDLKLVDDQNLLRGARQISVTSTDCAAAIDAMGLTMSLTIDPASLVSPAPAHPAVPAPAPAPEPAPPQPAAPSLPTGRPREEPEAVPSGAPRFSGHVGLGALASVSAAPSATVGAVAYGGLSWRMLSLDLEGRADLPATGAGQKSLASVRSWLVAGALIPCAHLGAPFGCVVVAGGSLGATSVGTAAPHTDHAPWWAVGLRAGAEAPLGGAIGVRAYAQVLATTTRDALSIDGAVAYTFAPWSGGVGADLAWRFP